MLALSERTALYIDGMHGLGDAIYQRPFVRAAAQHHDVWLNTSWPELYRDMTIQFVKPEIHLRTQRKNIARQPWALWSKPPKNAVLRRVHYGRPHLDKGMSINDVMDGQIGLYGDPYVLDLPPFPSPVISEKPVAVIRPSTFRQEWLVKSRAPKAGYLVQAAEILMRTHHVVSVADVEPPQEWYDKHIPFAHQRFDQGELTVVSLLGLIQHAHLVVGGAGWIVPASVAAKVHLGCILGGRGQHNSPECLVDARMDGTKVRWFIPDHFCRCSTGEHACVKTISNFSEQFTEWVGRIGT